MSFDDIVVAVLDLDITFSWMREMFEKADTKHDGVLSLKEITRLLKQLNIEMGNQETKNKIDVRI